MQVTGELMLMFWSLQVSKRQTRCVKSVLMERFPTISQLASAIRGKCMFTVFFLTYIAYLWLNTTNLFHACMKTSLYFNSRLALVTHLIKVIYLDFFFKNL